MTEVYSDHSAHLDELGKRQKVELIADYVPVVDFYRSVFCCRRESGFSKSSGKASQSISENNYLFIVTPLVNEDEEEDEENSRENKEFVKLKRSIESRFKAVSNQIRRQ